MSLNSKLLTAAVAPLLVNAETAAKLLGIARATFFRLQASGKVPAGFRLAGRRLWRVRDLEDFVACGLDIDRWRAERERQLRIA